MRREDAGPGRRVLLVDDAVELAEGLALLLRVDGHDVRVALNGVDALEAAAAFRPEVVVLDLGLPDLGGVEVARRLRLEGARPRLVALTGAVEEAGAAAGLFDHFLVKPVEPGELRRVVAG
jgi:DNA-binding response OmpR family regulator